jgi:response regulator RpfG family c-di-GMP phosphodiesterase
LAYIEERAGKEFEPEAARKFLQMMKELEGRVQRVPAAA